MSGLRIVFAGSPLAAVPSLELLARSEHDIVGVVTRDDSPMGRKRVLTPTPVAGAAESLGLPIVKARRLSDDVTSAIAALEPDLGVIVAFGGLVREPLLTLPRLGWINLHFSVLPRWRGAAPVQHAIIAGDEVTGASVFQLVDELDAGPVFGTVTQSVGSRETAGHLLETLATSGAELLLRVTNALADGDARAIEQSRDVTFAPKLTLDDGRLDWSLTAAELDHRIRGVTPEPGAFTAIDDGVIKILDAAIDRDAPSLIPGSIRADGSRILVGTASDALELVTVQPAGKRAMSASEWWRGRRGAAEGFSW